MKIELLVSQTFAACEDARRIWSAAASEYHASFAQRLGIHAVPLVVVDGKPLALGVLTLLEARQLLNQIH